MKEKTANKNLEGRMKFVHKRRELIVTRFNHLASQKIEGVRLDIDAIIYKISDELGYSPRTIKDIIKNRN
jgi:hypothetical protein